MVEEDENLQIPTNPEGFFGNLRPFHLPIRSIKEVSDWVIYWNIRMVETMRRFFFCRIILW
jgi:hypothetical protein